MAKMLLKVTPKPEQTAVDPKTLIDAIDRYYANVTNFRLEHIPVGIELIDTDKIPDVDLSIRVTAGPSTLSGLDYKTIRKKGLYISQAEIHALIQNGVKEVYVERADTPAFTQYIDQILASLPTSSAMVDEKKVSMLRGSSIRVMNEIFEAPTPENIQKGVKVVSNFVYVLMKDPKAYGMLLNLSSHDPYTLQHSVGCATNAIILAKKMGIDDEAALIEVGIGGLLHDVGKTKVAVEIINKKGPLTDEEWVEMRKHAMHGYEIVKDNPNVGTRAKLAVLQHHEEPGGGGYPMGLKTNQIDYYAQIVCLCDMYNALTTNRSYSNARPPFEAFQLIKSKLSHKIDAKLLDAMIRIYGSKE